MVSPFGAVVVALWQSYNQNRKHLEMTLRYAHTRGHHYLSITISNRGNRAVTLNRVSWIYNDKSTLLIPYEECLFISNGKQVIFPYHLSLSGSIDVLCPIEYVKSALQCAITEQRITAQDKIKVFVEDSQGDIFYSKTKLEVNKFV